ncbi:MAG TPA: MdtA/MuxA family multidrug efflux RND transporter periplasmic adaptor subunit [Thermoanaerobaculia bacterium]|nr:MdtA/MuxA family multidrug efflux RND transporter periplasmic adaptor subunit [Thermoanaerobaculia bacterium]
MDLTNDPLREEAGAERSADEATDSIRGRRLWPWACGLAAVALVIVLAATLRGQAPASKAGAAARAVPVVGLPARAGDLGVYESGLGTVTPLKTVTVRSRVDGELISVAFTEGQLVRKGGALAQIDSRPFEVQLHQAEGQLAKDESALKNAQLDLERYRVLNAQDSIPRQQLDTQAAAVDQIEASLKSDRAQIESAKLNLTYSRVTAPITGIVGLRQVDPGNIVRASDPNGLVVITQQQPISVLFAIPADHLQPVLRQSKAGKSLKVEAWDRDLQKKLGTGSVLAIDNQIDQATGTVRIKAQFPNEDSALYPNQFVNARLLVDTLRNATLIPTAAIQRSPTSMYVYVVKADSKVEMRNVEIQLTEGEDTAIRRGIAPGDIVVVDGLDKLQPGTLVSLAKEGGARKAKK